MPGSEVKQAPPVPKVLNSTGSATPTTPAVSFGWALLAVLALCTFTYVTLAASLPKFNRAEVFFAECAREMIETNNLVTPLYHGRAFFDKPILTYWAIIFGFNNFGISHLVARMPSVLAAVSTVALTAICGWRLFGRRAGLLSGMAVGSAFMFMSFATLCMSDMPLVLFDCIALSLMYGACTAASQRNVRLWLAALFMGFAFLTKGPIGIVLPSICYATYLTVTKQWRIIQWHHVLICSLIMAGAAIPWFMAAYRENGAGALSYFFIGENLQRFLGPVYDTHKPIYFMVVSLLAGFAPWSIFLLPATKNVVAEWKNKEQTQKPLVYSWLWIATVIGFFSLSRGKIDYYALTVYPAAAIIVAQYINSGVKSGSKLVNVLAWVTAAVCAIAGVGAAVTFPMILVGQDFTTWFAIPVILMVASVLVVATLVQKRVQRAYALIFSTICLAAVGFALQLSPWISSQQAVFAYVQPIAVSAPETRIGVFASLDNWIDELTFRTGREPLRVRGVAGVELFLKSKAPVLLLVPQHIFDEVAPELRAAAKILDRKPFAGHSISPGYIWKKRGAIADSTLLLVSNRH